MFRGDKDWFWSLISSTPNGAVLAGVHFDPGFYPGLFRYKSSGLGIVEL